MQKARTIIESIDKQFSKDYLNGDSVALAAHYAKDGQFGSLIGEEILSYWGRSIRNSIKNNTRNLIFTTTALTGDSEFLVELGIYEIKEDKNNFKGKDKYVVVWKQENGEWKATMPKIIFAKSVTNTDKGIVMHEDEGIHILTGRRKVPMTIKISKKKHGVDNISFSIEDMPPGRKMRIHKHLNNDELIFIHKGEGTLTLDEETIEVKTGTVIFVLRGTWHGLDNTGKENLLMAFQYSPAGFEEYFIENGTPVGMPAKERTAEEYAITEKKYGMVYKDPQ